MSPALLSLALTILDLRELGDVYFGMKVADLKPLYGAMFADLIQDFTHWGWVDIDSIFGDFTPLLEALARFDIVSFPDGVCAECSGE